MRYLLKKIKILALVSYAGVAAVAFAPFVSNALVPPAHAIPFGQGVFGANLFGSPTSLSVALSGNVNLNLTSDGSKYSASGSHTVTVSSSDVFGYNLYAYALNNSAMTGGSSTIPASSNSSAGALSLNSWGYNIDGSSNYLGLSTTPSLVRTAVPAAGTTFIGGDTTTVTYGVVTDLVKPAGSYTVSVVYTAACLSQ